MKKESEALARYHMKRARETFAESAFNFFGITQRTKSTMSFNRGEEGA